jgi:hypothetical protein
MAYRRSRHRRMSKKAGRASRKGGLRRSKRATRKGGLKRGGLSRRVKRGGCSGPKWIGPGPECGQYANNNSKAENSPPYISGLQGPP